MHQTQFFKHLRTHHETPHETKNLNPTVSVSETLMDNNVLATKTYKIHKTALTLEPENLILKHYLVF